MFRSCSSVTASRLSRMAAAPVKSEPRVTGEGPKTHGAPAGGGGGRNDDTRCAGSSGGAESVGGIFENEGFGRRNAQGSRGGKKQVRRRLGARDIITCSNDGERVCDSRAFQPAANVPAGTAGSHSARHAALFCLLQQRANAWHRVESLLQFTDARILARKNVIPQHRVPC